MFLYKPVYNMSSLYIISGQPVFLSHERWLHLRDEFLKTKTFFGSATDMIEAMMSGTKANKETEEFIHNFLIEQHDNMNPEKFYSEWVHFDIGNPFASEWIKDLLRLYLIYYGYASAYLAHLNLDDTVLHDVLALDHFVKPRSWWWKYTNKMTGRTVRVIVVPDKVYRIVGDLKNFMVYSRDFRLECGRDFTVLPPEKRVKERLRPLSKISSPFRKGGLRGI